MIRAHKICLLVTLFSLTLMFSRQASADNGTIVRGTVTVIDGVNKIMRVHVTAVNGQFLAGSPLTNYVDYLVLPSSVVYGPNYQLISQSYIQVGSNIELMFVGPTATTIMVMSQPPLGGVYSQVGGVTSYVPSSVTSMTSNRNFTTTQVQSFSPAHILHSNNNQHQTSNHQHQANNHAVLGTQTQYLHHLHNQQINGQASNQVDIHHDVGQQNHQHNGLIHTPLVHTPLVHSPLIHSHVNGSTAQHR